MPDRLAPLIRENTVPSIFPNPTGAMLPSELSWNSPPLSAKMVNGPCKAIEEPCLATAPHKQLVVAVPLYHGSITCLVGTVAAHSAPTKLEQASILSHVVHLDRAERAPLLSDPDNHVVRLAWIIHPNPYDRVLLRYGHFEYHLTNHGHQRDPPIR